MPKYGPFLPDIKNSFNKILEITQLEPGYYLNPEIYNERFFTTTAKNLKGDKYILKIRLEDYSPTKESFDRERFFVKFCSLIDTGNLITAEFNNSGEAPIEWMVYKYISGKTAGTMCELYNEFEQNFPSEAIIKSIFSLQEITPEIMKYPKGKIFPKKQSSEFIKEFDSYTSILNSLNLKNIIPKIKKLFQNNAAILDSGAAILSHGDFHPGNIIITRTGKPAVIDWEYVQLNNSVYDFAFLWSTFAGNPRIQDELKEAFTKLFKISDFELFFKLNLIRIIPQIISALQDRILSNPDKKSLFEQNLQTLKNKLLKIIE